MIAGLVEAAARETAHGELVEHLRSLLRLRTVNPPGDEILAARHLADVLVGEGLRPEVVEPEPGRGSVVARLRGDGTGGGPLLLLSHTDVVPAPQERWTHDPFGGDVADGYAWGRGAVDMKAMVAMELETILLLSRAAHAVGRDPASDPVPGLRRDVIFAATADEETGGHLGAGWLVDHRPDLVRADGALNEAGGFTVELFGRRFYPIQVAEKGYLVYRIVVRGSWGHGSVPRDDNAAVLAAGVIERLALPGAQRVTPLMAEAIERVAATLPAGRGETLRHVLHRDPRVAEAAVESLCQPPLSRGLRALLRDTTSPTVVHAGVAHNVIPGCAELIVDCRILPGTDEEAMTAELRRRIGEELWARCDIEVTARGAPVEQPAAGALWDTIVAALTAHDPAAVVVPLMAPFATDAKHTVRLGIPTHGFSPLRLGPQDPFLQLFHGDDERVGLDALRFGLPVLAEVVARYCG